MTETTDHGFSDLPPAAATLGHVFARPKVLAALCVIVLAALGWLYLALLVASAGGTITGSSAAIVQAFCRPLPDGSWSASGVAIVASMWSAMTLAMMLPSAAPMILTYAGIADTAARKGERIVSPVVIAAGYASVWLGFAAVATLTQIFLTRAALLDAGMESASNLFSGAILLGAGLYQFSALKHACLTHCQQPFPFFFANWATTPGGVFRLGLKQGLYCLGCCWAIMAVMFAVGVMNVVWMAALGVVMATEKLLRGRHFTHVIGVLLALAGGVFVLTAFAAHWPGWMS
ncbi:MAG: DUF2182 domain-containing protein [Sphingobacteriales bacterium]